MDDMKSNENTGGQKDHDNVPEDNDVLFGWRTFRPKQAQICRKPVLFFLVLVLCVAPQIIVSEMLPSVMRILKRRFNLSEKDANALVVVRGISAMVSTIVVGYLGSFRNKVRWIASGMAITGVGAVLFAMPHYDIEKYTPTNIPPAMLRYFGLCMSPAIGCSMEVVGKSHMALFVIGQILIGAGMGPLYTLVPAYIDENVSPRYMPIYIMLYYSNLLIGPVIGMLTAQFFLDIYVDIKQPRLMLKMTNKDMRWIGAWWLGYLILGICIIFHSIVVLSFPKRLPGSRVRRIEDMQDGTIPRNDPKINRAPSGIFYATTSLLRNKVFVFNTLAFCCIAFYMYAMGPFLFRIIMIKYGADPFKIGLPFGVVLLLGSLVGFLLGGFLTKRVGLKTIVKSAAFICLVTEAICVLTPLLFVIPGCDGSNIAGVSVAYPPIGTTAMLKQKGTSELTTACNAKCKCSTVISKPICGANNVAYFDPCHAGCLARPSEESFANCTCIPPTKPGYMGGEAKLGFCDRSCKSWSLFLVTMFIALVIFGANLVPSRTVVLRCVPYNQRSYALAVQSFMFILVALIPGHLVAYIMDKDCNIWQTDPCGRRGFCWDYKAETMGKSMAIFGFLVTALSVTFYFLSWYFCESPQTQNNNSQLLNSNGLGEGPDQETIL